MSTHSVDGMVGEALNPFNSMEKRLTYVAWLTGATKAHLDGLFRVCGDVATAVTPTREYARETLEALYAMLGEKLGK